ncbi:TPA: AAA family ATPase [Streptococcus suis]|uniref:type IV secretory system conjugative DNA transfer family protein n=1 Tax=Streptococcus suis TaxID=1307 RepID=UPI000CF5A49E|nr:AAA family ATPase [Streptococcus suis]MCK3870924.1 AAA family ATPase [Streptococcus suis]MCK4019921.1 AAA family ATPase [Streptococcus suis]NQI73213.1 AAA family ATPase [Streptococcus suis]NQK23701.1 AAA family ATPase [Streptococcus suis]NQL18146.1 AAA family ATPase [Streptococcus suis]
MKLLLDYLLFKKSSQFLREVPFDTSQPHLLCIGASGSGKTICAIALLAKEIYEYYQQTKEAPFLLIADYKADKDFEFLEELPTFFRFDEVDKSIDLTLSILEQRQSKQNSSKRKVILFIDEWGSYLSSKDNKQKNEVIAKLSRLMMLGRSFNIQVFVCNQRGDAEYFGKIRDNFSSMLVLGTLSKETIQMFFSEEKDLIASSNPRGVGYLKVSGKKTVKVIVPHISPDKLEICRRWIHFAVTSSSPLLSLFARTD